MLFAKDRPKLKKTYWRVNNIKMENNRFKVCIKNCMCFKNFDDIITFEDFDFDNTLIIEKSWFMTSHIKLWLMQNHCKLG